MSDNLSELESWLSALMSTLDSKEQRKLARDIGRSLRSSQARRIASQLNPDGTAFEPRKAQKATKARQQAGRIRREMFVRIRLAKHLRVISDADGVSIGFSGRTAQIANVHQYGLRDRVQPGGPEVKYPSRELLGFSDDDIESIKEMVLNRVTTSIR